MYIQPPKGVPAVMIESVVMVVLTLLKGDYVVMPMHSLLPCPTTSFSGSLNYLWHGWERRITDIHKMAHFTPFSCQDFLFKGLFW